MTERLILLGIAITFAVMGEGLASMCILAGYGLGWKQAEAALRSKQEGEG